MPQGDYSAAVYDVVMQQRDSFEEQFIVRDTDGSLIALGGYTFQSQACLMYPDRCSEVP